MPSMRVAGALMCIPFQTSKTLAASPCSRFPFPVSRFPFLLPCCCQLQSPWPPFVYISLAFFCRCLASFSFSFNFFHTPTPTYTHTCDIVDDDDVAVVVACVCDGSCRRLKFRTLFCAKATGNVCAELF